MHTYNLILAIAPLVLLVRAGIDYDLDDTPRVCRDICRPIDQLSDRCEVDLDDDDDDDDDDTEDLLEWQCFCTNDSFDVASIAALCADCTKQNVSSNDDNDDDDDDDDDADLEDINKIMYRCGFTSTTYASTATGLASGISVYAAAPTASSQLTTTITGGGQAPSATETSSSDDGRTAPNGVDSGAGVDDSEPTDNAAPAMIPLGSGIGFGLAYIAGAVVAGGMVMLC